MTIVGAIALLLGLLVTGLVLGVVWASRGSYPRDHYAEIRPFPTPRPEEAPAVNEAGDEFTVITYNLGYLSGLTNNEPVVRSPALFQENLALAIAALRAVSPDLLALQEVDLQARRSGNVDQVAALAAGLELPGGAIAVNWDKNYLPFPFGPPAVHFGRLVSGQAVLTRGAIARQERLVLEAVATQNPIYRAFYISRVAQIVELTLQGRDLVLINVHLEAFDAPTRRRQTEVVRQLLDRYAGRPLLLAGDFNSPLPSPAEPEATTTILLQDPRLEAVLAIPEARTYPSDQPEAKLDYLFYTPTWFERLEARVVTAAGTASDHLPLLARLRWRAAV